MKRFILIFWLSLLMLGSCVQAQQCRNGVCYAPAQQRLIQVQPKFTVTNEHSTSGHSHASKMYGYIRQTPVRLAARVGKFLRRR